MEMAKVDFDSFSGNVSFHFDALHHSVDAVK